MNSLKDAENFINIYQTYPLQIIYFNIYKPKQERIKTSQFLQKAGLNQRKTLYKQYNQFNNESNQMSKHLDNSRYDSSGDLP